MGTLSNWAENVFLDAAFGDGTLSFSSPFYIALCIEEVTDVDTGLTIVEATYSAYHRLMLTSAMMDDAASGQKINNTALLWPGVTADDETDEIVSWALCTDLTDGNIILFGDVSPSITIDFMHTPPLTSIGAFLAIAD